MAITNNTALNYVLNLLLKTELPAYLLLLHSKKIVTVS